LGQNHVIGGKAPFFGGVKVTPPPSPRHRRHPRAGGDPSLDITRLTYREMDSRLRGSDGVWWCYLPPHRFRNRIEHAVDEAFFAARVEGVSDIDIFVDDHACWQIVAREQFVGARAEDLAHRAVEPVD
jgi:hypothetical protein